MREPPAVCWICLDEAPDATGGRYHRACLEALFGVPEAPSVAFGQLEIASWADDHAGKLSISGQQPKGPAALTDDGAELILVERDSTHIVKPPQVSRASMIENEHLTMRLARLVGLDVAEHGLITLRDGAVAYLTRRFDRPSGRTGPRVHGVDFCQLAGKEPDDKADSTNEQCAALVREYAAPGSALTLFRLLLFSYWVRNGDLHLKNLMLLERADGDYVFSPAYDLLCTQPYEGNNWSMTFPLRGEKRNAPRRLWLDFAEVDCGLDRAQAAAVIDAMLARLPDAEALIERSRLPTPEAKREQVHWLRKRTRQLAGRV